jgi:hypothetical protein
VTIIIIINPPPREERGAAIGSKVGKSQSMTANEVGLDVVVEWLC